ncbi:MAG: helix-turn-helix transcriptional regulator [Bacteroidota bacterium]
MEEDICKLFGQKIRKLRLDKGWSQEQLSEVTDFHRTYIGMIERGERNPSLKSIERFAKAFDLKINQLFHE